MSSTIPPIGRYEVVGQLAMGGMAEILLGRLRGPSGFERVVAIKRVLPHLAQYESFTSMFLDEARIAAGIRHPNVVQVHELGQEGKDLFLVMEYLEGESLDGLLRRLTIVGQKLDVPLAVYIAAQVCAGLHAAHELPDAEGNPSGLVHRDISPQNVFITYNGAVKVLDFGIAKAANRITKTEAGTLKGKFAYMSPEQCLGEHLDRRSDLFSLGTVLYEMITGCRLFHRGAQLATLNAVVKDGFPEPSSTRSIPKDLNAITMCALERNKEDRYANASEFRHALARAAADMDGPHLPEEALADLMQALFPDRIREKSEVLRRVRAGSDLDAVPAAEVDIDIVLPTIGTGEWSSTSVSRARGREKNKRRFSSASAGLGVLLAAAVGFAAWQVAGAGSQPGPSVATRGGAPAVAAAPLLRPDREPATEKVVLVVNSDPTGAHVRLGDRDLGLTPLEVELDSNRLALELQVRHGTLGHSQSIVPDRDRNIQVILAEATPTPVPRPAEKSRSRRRVRRPEATTIGEKAAPQAPRPQEDFARFD